MAKAKKEQKKNLKKDAGTLIAGALNDITIPYFNDVFINTDPTLLARGGGKGLEIYEEIERDTEAYALLQKRKATLIEREWDVVAGGDKPADDEAAEFVRDELKRLPFDRICEGLLDATLKGYAVAEIVWGRRDNYIVPFKIKDQEQRRFVFDEHWNPRLLNWTSMWKGEKLPAQKFMVHRFGVKGNRPYGLGMGTRLYFPVLFKREGVTFWLKFLEKFASPTVVGKTPYGTLENDQATLLRTLRRFHSDGAITVPVDVDVELLEAKRSGSMSGNEWCNYWDKQMSIGILGETLTTDIGSVGSLAAAQVHSGILDKLVDSDSDLLSDTLYEQLISWMVGYNFPGAAIPRVIRKRPKNEKAEAETNKLKAEAAISHNDALKAKLAFVADIDNDDVARSILVASELVENLEGDVVDELINERQKFKTVTPANPLMGDNNGPPLDDDEAAQFAAYKLKKKHLNS